MAPVYPTVRIDETFIGDGVLDYNTYLREIMKLNPQPTLMIEHLNESQLIRGTRFIFRKADENGIIFEGSAMREERSETDAQGTYFAPHMPTAE